MRVFTLGDIKRDTFVAVPDASLLCAKQNTACRLCFSYGEKISAGAFFSQIAGTAPNVAIGLKKLGHETSVVSTVGRDRDGDDAEAFLREADVGTEYLFRKPHAIMTHAVVLNFQGESTQLVAHNDTKHVFPKKLPRADLLHISEIGNGYKTLFRDILSYHKKSGTPLSINPGTVQLRERSREFCALLKICRVLFVNKKEAAALTTLPPSSSPQKLLRSLLALGPHTAVLTDGVHGAYAANQRQSFFSPAFSAIQKDATGAGDAFSVGVLGALLAKKPVAEALLWGAANSASVVEYIGPTAGLLSVKEIRRRMRRGAE